MVVVTSELRLVSPYIDIERPIVYSINFTLFYKKLNYKTVWDKERSVDVLTPEKENTKG